MLMKNLTYMLSGEFAINPTDGTFEGQNLALSESSKASLYGSFFGANAGRSWWSVPWNHRNKYYRFYYWWSKKIDYTKIMQIYTKTIFDLNF